MSKRGGRYACLYGDAWRHPQLAGLPPDAFGLWARSLSYVADNATDGSFPWAMVAAWASGVDVASAIAVLIASKRWKRSPDGAFGTVLNWTDNQPTSAEWSARTKAETAKRQARRAAVSARMSGADNPPDTTPDTAADKGADSGAAPPPDIEPDTPADTGEDEPRQETGLRGGPLSQDPRPKTQIRSDQRQTARAGARVVAVAEPDLDRWREDETLAGLGPPDRAALVAFLAQLSDPERWRALAEMRNAPRAAVATLADAVRRAGKIKRPLAFVATVLREPAATPVNGGGGMTPAAPHDAFVDGRGFEALEEAG